MAFQKLLVVSLRWNGFANVCSHCGKQARALPFATGYGHIDSYVSLCGCGAGEPFETVYGRLDNVTEPLQHYLDSIAGLEAQDEHSVLDVAFLPELWAPEPAFLLQLRVASGLAFDGRRVADLNGAALFSGQAIFDNTSGAHCIVLDAERAVRQGYTAWRKDGGWQPSVSEQYLTVTSTPDGLPVCVTWQDEEHRMLEVLFEAPTREAARLDPGAGSGTMSARDIAVRLPIAEWEVRAQGDAYLNVQTRLTMRVERNLSMQALAYEEGDPFNSSAQLVDDILTTVGDFLSPCDEMFFVEKLAARLTEWQAKSGREDDWVGDQLAMLVAQHQATKGGPRLP